MQELNEIKADYDFKQHRYTPFVASSIHVQSITSYVHA